MTYKQLERKYIHWYWNMQHEWEPEWAYRYENLFEVCCWVLDTLAPFALCGFFFHSATDDHCGRPEHRYCWKCGKLTPHWEVKRGN